MTRRALSVLAALCVASSCVMLLWMAPGGTPATGSARQLPGPKAYRMAEYAPGGPAQRLDVAGTTPGQVGDQAAAPPDFGAVRRDATSAAEPEDRIRALQILAEAPADISMDVLVGAATNGTDARERAMAITSLRQLLPRAGADGDLRARNALQAALSDPDPVVAMLSQSLLEDLGGSR